MDEQQLTSIKLRAAKALTKWMRWETENNKPVPTIEELSYIMAEVLAEQVCTVKRRPGPGRPKKVKVTVVEPTLKVK